MINRYTLYLKFFLHFIRKMVVFSILFLRLKISLKLNSNEDICTKNITLATKGFFNNLKKAYKQL